MHLSLMISVSRSSSCGTIGSLGSPLGTLHVASDLLSRSHTSPGPVSAAAVASTTVDDYSSIPEGVNGRAPSESESAAAETGSFPCSFPSAANPHAVSLPNPVSVPSIRQPLMVQFR